MTIGNLEIVNYWTYGKINTVLLSIRLRDGIIRQPLQAFGIKLEVEENENQEEEKAEYEREA
jgi:hypothetical protein